MKMILRKLDIFIIVGLIISVGLFGYIRSVEVEHDTDLLLQNQKYFTESGIQHDQATKLIIVNEQLIIDALRNSNHIGNQTDAIYDYLFNNQTDEPKPIPYNITLYVVQLNDTM